MNNLWPEWDIVLPDGVEDEPDVWVDEGELGVVLPAHQQGQVPGTLQQLQRCRHLQHGIKCQHSNFKIKEENYIEPAGVIGNKRYTVYGDSHFT